MLNTPKHCFRFTIFILLQYRQPIKLHWTYWHLTTTNPFSKRAVFTLRLSTLLPTVAPSQHRFHHQPFTTATQISTEQFSLDTFPIFSNPTHNHLTYHSTKVYSQSHFENRTFLNWPLFIPFPITTLPIATSSHHFPLRKPFSKKWTFQMTLLIPTSNHQTTLVTPTPPNLNPENHFAIRAHFLRIIFIFSLLENHQRLPAPTL